MFFSSSNNNDRNHLVHMNERKIILQYRINEKKKGKLERKKKHALPVYLLILDFLLFFSLFFRFLFSVYKYIRHLFWSKVID